MLKLGYFVLLLFVKNLKFINFSTNSKQRKEIISYLVELTDLIDGLFERGELSLTELINVLKNNNGKHPHNKKIIVLIKRIKDVSKNNECHQKFLYNLVKSWEAENIRRNNHFLIKDDTIKNAQDRGKFYFLALIYSLSPIQLNKNQIKIISICGSWFQIMDDYKDIAESDHTSGKSTGNDLFKGKITLPIIRTAQNSPEDICNRMKNILSSVNNDGHDLSAHKEQLHKLFKQNGSLDYTYQQAPHYTNSAIKNLKVLKNSTYKDILIALAESVIA